MPTKKKDPWGEYNKYLKGERMPLLPFPHPLPTQLDRLWKKIKNWNWKWMTMATIAAASVIIAGIVGYHGMTAVKTNHKKISWSYDYPQESYPGMKVQRRGFIQIKEGSHDRELLFHIGTCEVADNGQKYTIQASIRENAKYESEIGLPVVDKCSEAVFRYHTFKCCWVD